MLTEKQEKVVTLIRRDKKQLLRALGDAEVMHGESFPQSSILRSIDENKAIHEYMRQVGENHENMPEDANL